MANVQIPNLTPAIAATRADMVEAVQAGSSVRMTLGQIVDLAGGGGGGDVDIPSIENFGIIADGVTDQTSNINAAWAQLVSSGRIPLLSVPPSQADLVVRGALTPPAGAGLVGLFGYPQVLMSGTQQTVVSQPDFLLRGLTLVGDQSTSNYKIAITSTGAVIEDCKFYNWNSGVQLDGNRNTVRNCMMTNIRGAGIRINGDYNTIEGIDGQNVTLFLIYLTDDAAYNSIKGVWKKLDIPTLTPWQQENRAAEIAVGQFGLECVGITEGCHHNHISDYYAENTSDAAFSCSGYENVISNGRSQGCAGNGITMIGSRNIMTGLVSIGDKRAVGCVPTAGGLSKDNVAIGCIGINNWYAAFTNERTQLRQWVSAGTYPSTSTYCWYGLNNYRTSPAVDTFGTIPPTHTSGTVSDGLVNWTFVSSDPETLNADRNNFIGCKGINSGQGIPGSAGTGEIYYIATGSGAHTRIYMMDPVPADPVNPQQGDVWYNSTTSTLRARIDGSTIDISAGGGGSPFNSAFGGTTTQTISDLSTNTATFERSMIALDVTGGGTLTTLIGPADSSQNPLVFMRNRNSTPVILTHSDSGLRLNGHADRTLGRYEGILLMRINGNVWQEFGDGGGGAGSAFNDAFGGMNGQTVSDLSTGSVTFNRSMLVFDVSGGGTLTTFVGPADASQNPLVFLRNRNVTPITITHSNSGVRLNSHANRTLNQYEGIILMRIGGNIWQEFGWNPATGGVTDGDKGDLTVSSGGTVWTIDAGVVTLAKQAALAALSIIGNATGSAATPSALSAADVRTLINVADGATANQTDAYLLDRANQTGTQAAATITGLATVATSGAFPDLSSKPTTLAGYGITDATEVPWLTPVSGEYVLPALSVAGFGTVAGGAGRCDMFPFVPRVTFTITDVSINCTTGVASALAKVAFYSTDADQRPTTLLLETADMDCSTAAVKTTAAALTFEKGKCYFIAVRTSSTATLATFTGNSTPDINGGGVANFTRKILRRTITYATGAPSSWGFTSSEIQNAGAPTAVWLKV